MSQLDIETINENTSMIDMELFGVKRIGALYLIKGDKTCVLDSGSNKEAKGLVKALDSIGAFPPDMIILTHSHYDGYFDGKDAQDFPNEAVTVLETWWNVFVESDKKGKLDDITYMREAIVKKTNLLMPEIEIGKASMRIMLSLMNTGRKIFGKEPIDVGNTQLEGLITWLVKGYKGATQ